MKRKLWLPIFFSAVAVLASDNARAEGWYVGGGAVTSNLEKDLDEDISQGFGIAFSGGYSANELFGLELLLSSSVHDEDRRDGYLLNDTLMLGGKFSFGRAAVRPYVAAGISLNSVEFEYFRDIDGDGFYWGVGADIFINQHHDINVSFRLNDWEGDASTRDYDVRNRLITVAYNYYFSGY